MRRTRALLMFGALLGVGGLSGLGTLRGGWPTQAWFWLEWGSSIGGWRPF